MSDDLRKDKAQGVPCDMCAEEDRKPAKKTCMKCEISMCVQHLQAHLTTPVLLQTHPLTEPMALCGSTKCLQHGKLLEYYCLDDMTCVCVSCAIEDQHRLHNMKTFSTAHKELVEKLNAQKDTLRAKNSGKEDVSLEKWEKAERDKLSHCGVRLIEAVTNLRDLALNSVQSSVSARMASIRKSESSIRAAQMEKDTFRFLQMYAQVHQDVQKAMAMDLRRGLEPGSRRDQLVQKIRENRDQVMRQAGDFWGSLLTMVDPDQKLSGDTSHLIFKPLTLGPGMSLSKDDRKVFHNSFQGQLAAVLPIQSTQSDSKCHSWLLSLSKDIDWTIGLCDQQSAHNMSDYPVFGLCCKNNQLSSVTSEKLRNVQEDCSMPVRFPFGSARTASGFQSSHRRVSAELVKHQESEEEKEAGSETVEVFWNVVASSLSFFRRTRQYLSQEILTIKLSPNSWNLSPFVQLGMENAQNLSTGQSYLKCHCGRKKKLSNFSHGQLHYTDQANCSCGRIPRTWTTEVVCELL